MIGRIYAQWAICNKLVTFVNTYRNWKRICSDFFSQTVLYPNSFAYPCKWTVNNRHTIPYNKYLVVSLSDLHKLQYVLNNVKALQYNKNDFFAMDNNITEFFECLCKWGILNLKNIFLLHENLSVLTHLNTRTDRPPDKSNS